MSRLKPQPTKTIHETAFSNDLHREPARRENHSTLDSLPERDSGILVAVRRELFPFLLVPFAVAAAAWCARAQSAQPAWPVPAGQPASQIVAPVPPQAPGQPGMTPHNALALVVLDPAHGGADQGARGSSGVTESDVVLSFARLVRISLEGQGLRAILTRQANEGPSFDDRSKVANSQRGAIFISLHVS